MKYVEENTARMVLNYNQLMISKVQSGKTDYLKNLCMLMNKIARFVSEHRQKMTVEELGELIWKAEGMLLDCETKVLREHRDPDMMLMLAWYSSYFEEEKRKILDADFYISNKYSTRNFIEEAMGGKNVSLLVPPN